MTEAELAEQKRLQRNAATRAYRMRPEVKAKHLARNKEWFLQNPGYLNKYGKKYQQKHKDRIAARKRVQRATEESKVQRAEWGRRYRADPDVKLAHRLKESRRRAAKGTADIDVQRIWILQRGKCAYCKEKLKKNGWDGFHIDHIQPLVKGGKHVQNNIQLTCADCNMRKGKKDPVNFAQSLGLML